jgi:hypothetical protein
VEEVADTALLPPPVLVLPEYEVVEVEAWVEVSGPEDRGPIVLVLPEDEVAAVEAGV